MGRLYWLAREGRAEHNGVLARSPVLPVFEPTGATSASRWCPPGTWWRILHDAGRAMVVMTQSDDDAWLDSIAAAPFTCGARLPRVFLANVVQQARGATDDLGRRGARFVLASMGVDLAAPGDLDVALTRLRPGLVDRIITAQQAADEGLDL